MTSHLWKLVYNRPETLLLNCLLDGEAYAITSANHHRARYQAFIARSQVKTLEGILPICAHCKKIRDDRGYYQQLEKYLSEHSEASFSHGICPDCLARYYPREK